MNIEDPGLRFAPPWAPEVYHAFGVLLRVELLKLPYCRVFFYAKHVRSAGLFSERLSEARRRRFPGGLAATVWPSPGVALRSIPG